MLIDSCGRVVDYLRISVTSRCNFRCSYCMPEKPLEWVPKEELLSYEQMFDFLRFSIDRGVSKIRITGGEPLVRGDLDRFIKMLYGYESSLDLAVTTNGFLLEAMAAKLAAAGLKRVNVSLDTLESEKFHSITKKDALSQVLKGLHAARKEGLKVKLNTVVMKDINDTEILSLYRYAKIHGYEIRFIEFMENESADSTIKSLSGQKILETITQAVGVQKRSSDTPSAATAYEDEDGYRFGIIEPYDDSFCKSCNKLRLSAQGDLIPCLYFEDSLSLSNALKNKDAASVEKIVETVLQNKPQKNRWSHNANEFATSARSFYTTGG